MKYNFYYLIIFFIIFLLFVYYFFLSLKFKRDQTILNEQITEWSILYSSVSYQNVLDKEEIQYLNQNVNHWSLMMKDLWESYAYCYRCSKDPTLDKKSCEKHKWVMQYCMIHFDDTMPDLS